MTLSELAIKYGSDKEGHHSYCGIYERYLKELQSYSVTLLELGIGGYHYPDRGGASLKMWYDYFPNASIIGVDIHTKTGLCNDRIKTVVISQDSDDLLTLSQPDIVIDDASHINPLTIRSFEILFPRLKSGGFYFIEDIESSWCPVDGWANGCDEPNNMQAPSSINFFRKLINEINTQFIPHHTQTYPIEFIHFYKNIIVIKKL